MVCDSVKICDFGEQVVTLFITIVGGLIQRRRRRLIVGRNDGRNINQSRGQGHGREKATRMSQLQDPPIVVSRNGPPIACPTPSISIVTHINAIL